MLPAGFLQDLLSRVDIVEVVGRQVALKKAGTVHKGLCPFHGEKSPSFTVSPSRQTYHCFGCGAHGDAIRFLTEQTGMGFMDAVRDLAQQVGLTVPDDRESPEDRARATAAKARQATLTEVLDKAAGHFQQALKASPRAIDYCKRRGLSGQIAKRFGLGYAPEGWRSLASVFARYDDPLLAEAGLVIVQGEPEDQDPASQKRYDRFRDRLMFPIRSVKGEVIGFGGRVLDQGEPKYLNSPETPVFHKGQELYGLYEARTALRKAGHVLVVEGYMDVVALAQWGFGQAVATLGTACTAEHVAKLFRFTDTVVFSFDGDAAGRRAAGRALEAALPYATDTRSIRFLFLPPEHDPDSYVRAHGAEAFAQAVGQAVPLSEQLLSHAAEDCDLQSAEGRARMLAQARPLLDALPEGLLRAQLLGTLAERAGIALAALQAHWAATPASPNHGNRRADAPAGTYASAQAPADTRAGAERRTGTPFAPRRAGRGPRSSLAAATRLDRAAWLLARHADQWHGLGDGQHAWLCSLPPPHGAFFCGLERLLHEHGPMTLEAINTDLASEIAQDAAHELAHGAADDASAHGPLHADANAALGALLAHINRFHALDREPPVSDLQAVLRQLEAEELGDELNAHMAEYGRSGTLSPELRERVRWLQERIKQLKTAPNEA